MPKLVNLKTLSMIHMRLARTPGRGFHAAIRIGTSAVLWWLDSTNVRRLEHAAGSSPLSSTEDKWIEDKVKTSGYQTATHYEDPKENTKEDLIQAKD
ncbi:hypothetical protein RR46_03232 [Papilio xuthus]|uniref:Uncharacterized protein n=1 Tax=Papilio xuthus TaxID=66420 RepID=A0A194QMC4_PAPXU|nr:hypothetical protein RR46_03232 [Papilio xuthus]